MKLAGLLVLMLSWSAVATELSELQAQQLLEQKKYQTIISKINDMAPYELVSHKVTALLRNSPEITYRFHPVFGITV